MSLVSPKNYKEITIFKKCVSLKRFVPQMDAELFNKIFNHIAKDSENFVQVSDGMLSFGNPDNRNIDAIAVPPLAQNSPNYYLSITLKESALTIVNP